MTSLRVVTWNLQGSQLRDLAGVAERIRALDADLVCLQEVQRRQARRIRSSVGSFSVWSFKHWPVRTASEGHALLSRAPIVRNRTFTLSRGEPFWSWRRRIMQAFVIELDGSRVRVVNTHLGAGVGDDERSRQARRIMSLIRDVDIVAGDLNVHPDSGVLREFEGLVDAWDRRHPSVRSPHTNWEPGARVAPPVQRLDYVLVAGGWEVIDVVIPTDWERWAPLSDHLPVVVDLRRSSATIH